MAMVKVLCLLFLFASALFASSQLIEHDEEGNRTMLWVAMEKEKMVLKSALFSPRRGWLEPIILAEGISSKPLLVKNRLGQLVAVWQGCDERGVSYLEAARGICGKGWVTQEILSCDEEKTVGEYTVSLDEEGGIVVTWSSSIKDHVVLKSRTAKFNGGWEPSVSLE